MKNLNAIIALAVGVIVSIIHKLAIPLYLIVTPEQVMNRLKKFSSLSILVASAFHISEIWPALH